jgi:hypothetical protein
MTIIRVEHKDGYGMMRFNEKWRYVVGCDGMTSRMYDLHMSIPSVCSDITGFTTDMFCAFDSMESFYGFIVEEELRYLILKQDFKVFMIDADFVLKGTHQVAYTKESITQKKDITNLFL